MQQKNNGIFTKRVLELNGSIGFNDSLSSCNRILADYYVYVTQGKAVARIYLRSQDGRGRFPACQGYFS